MNIYIPDSGCHNIYHFLIYMVSTLKDITYLPETIYIDMSNVYFQKNHNFVVEILSTLYPNSKIYNSKNYPDNTQVIPKHTLKDFHNDKQNYHTVYKYLHAMLMPHVLTYNLKGKYLKYIYISRNDSPYRRVLNETDIMNYLEPRGFQKVILTGIPLLEQMAMFHNAEIIITVHGAALTNSLFCKPNTRIIELNTPFLQTKRHFEDIAECFNLNYSRYINTKSIHNHDLMANDLIVNDIHTLLL
jgi:capsular polysaccharide biosynthesis protein